MAQNVYLFVDEVTPEIITSAQEQGVSCVYAGIPPHFQAQADRENWVLPHTLTIHIEEFSEPEDVL